MRDPLAEPQTNPIQIRRGDVERGRQIAESMMNRATAKLREPSDGTHFTHATDGGCPHIGALGMRCDGDLGHAEPEPVTVRDLIRWARLLGFRRTYRARGMTTWETNHPSVIVEVTAETIRYGHDGLRWYVRISTPHTLVKLRDNVTPQRIVDAARLCGWGISGRP
jgi:hypothetical protein